jgi:hypothetical protein
MQVDYQLFVYTALALALRCFISTHALARLEKNVRRRRRSRRRARC